MKGRIEMTSEEKGIQEMTEEEKRAWGKAEADARLADIAAVKAGTISLEDAQRRARSRSRKSGMTPTESYSWMSGELRDRRYNR